MSGSLRERVAEALLLDWHGNKPVPAPLRDEARRVADTALAAVCAHIKANLEHAADLFYGRIFDEPESDAPVRVFKEALARLGLPVPQGEEQ